MKIIFCLPGASFSGRFLKCWTELLGELPKVGISYGLSQQYLCNIYHVRTKCLGASLDRGTNQKPFGGEIDYDYIMWIDSDIVFKPEQFFKLLDHDRDIVSGLYMMQDNINYATVEHMDEDFFAEHAYYRFLQRKDLKKKKGKLFQVDYTGMGWMLVKKGVFESFTYPWFYPRKKKYPNGWEEFVWDDVEFCHRARDNNYDIWVDPNIIVGHEKTVVL